MSILDLLRRHGRARARGRAARAAARVALLGGLLVAVALLLARMGLPVPFLRLPETYRDPSLLERVFGFLVVSIAGLVQGAVLLAAVVAAALLVRTAGAFVLRRGPAATARALDRVLGTDRFCAALEARGRLADLARRAATERPPRPDALAPARQPRLRLRLGVTALLVLLVALMPGTAPGGEGEAPGAGPPDGGDERPLRLALLGESRTYGLGEAVPVDVVIEATAPPRADLDLPVRIVIDGGNEIDTGERFFLPAGDVGQDSRTLDLRAVAGALPRGKHVAVARAGDAESNEYHFEVEPPDDGGGGAASPPPRPEPDPPRPEQGDGGGGAQPEWKPKFVEPLVQEGEKVRKRARVPIEAPGGGAPSEQTLEEAWPELERRKEAALKRPGLSPAARQLVRRYFERLRPAEGER